MTPKSQQLTRVFFNDVIKLLSDMNMQKRCWFGIGGDVCDSYDEMNNSFHTFLQLFAKNPSQYGLNEEEYQLLCELKEKINEYEKKTTFPYDHPKMDENDSWKEVVNFAMQVYQKLIRFEDLSMQ